MDLLVLFFTPALTASACVIIISRWWLALAMVMLGCMVFWFIEVEWLFPQSMAFGFLLVSVGLVSGGLGALVLRLWLPESERLLIALIVGIGVFALWAWEVVRAGSVS